MDRQTVNNALLRRRKPGILLAAMSCTLILHPQTSAAYSFVPSSRQRSILQLTTPSVSTPSTRKHQTSSLVMKKPKLDKSLQQPAIPTNPLTEMPANLKRQVNAKRPTLGHVVPKNSRTRHLNEDSSSGGSNSAALRPQGVNRDTERYNNPSNLRILGGSVRGRKLESPTVYLRPMMGKVKEAVYSTFTSFGLYENNQNIGGGVLALAQQGIWISLVDRDLNIVRCGFDGWNEGGIGTGIGEGGEPIAKVVCTDAFRALRQPETVGIDPSCKYDLVTLCPPYEEIVYADLLDAVANSELVTEDTVILIEYPVELGCLPHAIGREDGGVLIGIRNRKYGRTVIAMYIVNPTGARETAESRPEEFITI
eukprot:g428.t1 g428   contig10:17086-18266(+)